MSSPDEIRRTAADLTSKEDMEWQRYARILRNVEHEIAMARWRGETQTKYRPFEHWTERVGAMCCGVCGKPSTHVSYLVGIKGRLALCAKHVHNRITKNPTATFVKPSKEPVGASVIYGKFCQRGEA